MLHQAKYLEIISRKPGIYVGRYIPYRRGAPEAEGAALGIGSAAAAAAARSRRVSMVVSSDHGDREVGEQKVRESGCLIGW